MGDKQEENASPALPLDDENKPSKKFKHTQEEFENLQGLPDMAKQELNSAFQEMEDGIQTVEDAVADVNHIGAQTEHDDEITVDEDGTKRHVDGEGTMWVLQPGMEDIEENWKEETQVDGEVRRNPHTQMKEDTPPSESSGLKLKRVKKLEIIEEDIDINQFSSVIGPLYIMEHLANNPARLPKAELYPLLEVNDEDWDDDDDDWQYKLKVRDERHNLGLITHEKIMRDRDRRSRFYGQGRLTRRMKRGKKDILGNSWKKRGLASNRFFRRNLQFLLPRKMRSPPHNLSVLHKESTPNMGGLNSVRKFNDVSLSYLPRIDLGKPMSFNIVNTVTKLDAESNPIRRDETIFLQWSRAGKVPSIRDIRVDGVPDERNRLERIAWFLDRNLGHARIFIDEYKLPIGAGLGGFAVLLVLIFSLS